MSATRWTGGVMGVGQMSNKMTLSAMTQSQAVAIVRGAVNGGARALARDGVSLDLMLEKRVRQVARNSR